MREMRLHTVRSAGGACLLALLACAIAGTASAAKPSVYYPVDRVICDRKAWVCYDPLGASVPLTKAHLGNQAANLLQQRMTNAGKAWNPNRFVLSNGIECFVAKKACFVSVGSEEVDPEATKQLFGNR